MLTTKVGDKGLDVSKLQRALKAMAYPIKEDGIYGPATARAVMEFQRANGLAINGDANAETIALIKRKVPAEFPSAPSVPVVSSDALALAGERAFARALWWWQQDIYDPRVADETENGKRCKAIIADIITRVGWGWSLQNGQYVGNGPPQWCGLFAAECWLDAGLDPQWVATFWASTYRLAYWFQYKPLDGKSSGNRPLADGRMYARVEPGRVPKMPDGTMPRRGDVVIVGDGNPVHGDHITLLDELEISSRVIFHTVSGNGGGIGPTGKHREGTVKTDYSIDSGRYRVMFVGRPGIGDLVAA